jgi:hypothetical protein
MEKLWDIQSGRATQTFIGHQSCTVRNLILNGEHIGMLAHHKNGVSWYSGKVLAPRRRCC